MSIANARDAEAGTKVKVDGVVAQITYANGMIPAGLILVDNTGSIYVYDNNVASACQIGNTITVQGVKDYWILETELTSVSLAFSCSSGMDRAPQLHMVERILLRVTLRLSCREPA